MKTVITKSYDAPDLSKEQILRYAGAKYADEKTDELLESVLLEAEGAFIYKVCYIELDASVSDGICDFGLFKIESQDLAKNLSGCKRAVLFAATVGIGIDRLISKYSRTSPAKALMLQALGTERVEALCDLFSEDIKGNGGAELRPRFSIGYGDTDLSQQKDILNILDASRKIGISLNESMLMSPTKSVTAFIGKSE